MQLLKINRISLAFGSSVPKKLYYQPFLQKGLPTSQAQLDKITKDILTWSRINGAKYYSFLANPLNQGFAEKQQTFLTMEFNKKNLIEHLPLDNINFSHLSKGEGDGSSFPNGFLRKTNSARAYFLWDWKSPLFIKKSNQVMYIPAMLVSHHGDALDDRTIYRKAESKMDQSCSQLLRHLKVQNNGTCIFLGLEQQFFIIHKKDYQKRIDLMQTNRGLLGSMPPHSQQFSDHYYGKLQNKIEIALQEAEKILTQMGVPIKTRHKQVAPNQFEFCSIHEEASQSIDHNLLKMQVVGEVLDSYGYVPLWHEKPFSHINGSGKHINWSLNYLDKKGKIINLFKPEDCQDLQVFWLFFFLHAKALAKNQHLYHTAISVPGNQLRLGGHEAPPRILSFAAGDYFRQLMNKASPKGKKNLKQKIPHLLPNIMSERQDRNRTSPYAYVSGRFEYRAVGSTQNCFFPMSIILGTYAQQIQNALNQLKSGVSVQNLIQKLKQETENIRYDGDGYSQGWEKEAEKRGLYVNKKYSENFSNLVKYGDNLIKAGIYNKSELESKAEVLKQNYVNTVLKEIETFLIILNKNVFPRSFRELRKFSSSTTSQALLDRKKNFEDNLQKLAIFAAELEKDYKNVSEEQVYKLQTIRKRLAQGSQLANKVTQYLPESSQWPELYSILGTI